MYKVMLANLVLLSYWMFIVSTYIILTCFAYKEKLEYDWSR